MNDRETARNATSAFSSSSNAAPTGAGASEKKPILFDDHTDLTMPEIQYFVDARIGNKTCQARCEFCFFDKPHIQDHVETPEQAMQRIALLRAQGYKVVPIVADTFAEDGRYLRAGLFRNNDAWYMGNAAWSSGRPLLQDNHEELLSLCVDSGIQTIIMTSHGTEEKERPFKGLTQPGIVREAVRRIRLFEAKRDWKFKITLTFTIGQFNRSREQIQKYLDYCDALGVDVCRFNRFMDAKHEYPSHILSRSEVEETYRLMKETYDAHPGPVQMSISEDFGFWGVEVMGFPAQVGHCVAGENLFGMIYPNLYVCPVNMTVVCGKMLEDGTIEWDAAVRERLMKAKSHPKFDGCFGVSYPHHQEIREIVHGRSPTSLPVLRDRT